MSDIKWLSIKANEMMRDTMNAFIGDLKKNSVEYQSYVSPTRIYIEIENDISKETEKLIHEWSYYNPITVLKNEPDLENCDCGYW